MRRTATIALCLASAGIAALAGACGRRADPPPTTSSSAAEPMAVEAPVAAPAATPAVIAPEPSAASAGGATEASASAPPSSGELTCTELPFAESTPLPEASGAAWLVIDGELSLVVISDSGNDGQYAVVDPESGVTRERGKLPLGGSGSDLEGIAARGGKLYVITSPGWIHVYERRGAGFALIGAPYALGPIDLDAGTGLLGDRPPAGTGMVCAANRINCGRNYEGLCLAPSAPAGPCVGFAASKSDGKLHCLVERGGKLAVQYEPAIAVARPGAMADCAFAEDGALYAGSNVFDAGNVYRVTGWQDPARATVTNLGPMSVGFAETLAVRGDVFYRMSDTGGAPSLMKKYRCAPAAAPPAR